MTLTLRRCADAFESARTADATPIWGVRKGSAGADDLAHVPAAAVKWAKAQGFEGQAEKFVLCPDADGTLLGVMFGLGDGADGTPCGSSVLRLGAVARALPAGTYTLAAGLLASSDDATQATLAWGLGRYRFDTYRTKKNNDADATACEAKLAWPADVDVDATSAQIEAIWFGRDLINTPASDLGPAEMEDAVRTLGALHGCDVSAVVGDQLLDENFPMIHAVGRASTRAPRLVDLKWTPKSSRDHSAKPLPKVTLVGKGICFDTGGLDIKPAPGMILMKKDMGGAAAALAIAHMIMQANLPVQLRVLIPTADNNIAGNAFRPSDILTSRKGPTVEIGNTDAEGRLVLADAMALADADEPDIMITTATLTGAARVALGVDLPALFATDDAFADSLLACGMTVGDPMWRMPFWPGYDALLKSKVADMNNIGGGGFAGAITAALFLKRFVSRAKSYAHIDLYGWRESAVPLGIAGGEAHSARAVFAALKKEFPG